MNGAPNLARDPFLNRRPVLRVALAFWLLAASLTLINAWKYWGNYAGRGEQLQARSELEPRIAEERRLLAEAESTLGQFDLDWQRRQVIFLNAMIEARTFAWSALFDDLSQVLPRNVRIERVVPRTVSSAWDEKGSSSRPQSAVNEVALEIAGTAREADALLILVDAFYAHERFRRPNLKVESRGGASAEVQYSMNVVYEPAGPSTGADSAALSQEVEEPEAAPEAES